MFLWGRKHTHAYVYAHIHAYVHICMCVCIGLYVYTGSLCMYICTHIHKYSPFPRSSINMSTQPTVHTNETNRITAMGHIRPSNQFSANGYGCLLLKPHTLHVQPAILHGPHSVWFSSSNTWFHRWGRKIADIPASYVIYHFICVWAKEFKPWVSAACKVAWGSGHLPQRIPCLVSMCCVSMTESKSNWPQ